MKPMSKIEKMETAKARVQEALQILHSFYDYANQSCIEHSLEHAIDELGQSIAIEREGELA